jgi:hypothetical protein
MMPKWLECLAGAGRRNQRTWRERQRRASSSLAILGPNLSTTDETAPPIFLDA